MNKPIKLGGLGMLDIVELDSSLKLRALGRLRDTRHPFLGLIREKIKLDEFFFPVDKYNLDEVCSQAIKILRIDRQKLWANRSLDSNMQYVNAIKTSRLWSALTPNGRQSLAYMRARLNGRIILGDLSLAECRSLTPFLDTSLYEALNATAPIPLRYVGGLAPLNYSVLRNNKFYDLSQLTSKQIRETRSCLTPIAIFKLGPALNATETVSWGHSLRKITSTRHKDLILRLIHG